VVICYNCNSPGHFARNCTMMSDLSSMNTPVFQKVCAKCKRFGHWKSECTPAVQMRSSKCYNCGQFGHFAASCVNRQVDQQSWSYPRQVPQPPPDPPLAPTLPCPPPPPPVPVYSWWPRGSTLLGESAPNVAPNIAPDVAPKVVRTVVIDLTSLIQGPHTGEDLSPD
jgi:hypothetical protein